MENKKFWLSILIILVHGMAVIGLLVSCASFGVYGSIDYVDEKIFIVNISVPPISGGGSPSINFQSAMKYAAKEVKKQGGDYFIIVQGGYNEQLRDISFNYVSGDVYLSRNVVANNNYYSNPRYATASFSNYVVAYALPDEEEEFLEWAKQKDYQPISANLITRKQ
jgi:ABC-type Na+ efflux pump permease subunit